MPTSLIIGASRGIGREFVRQLLADGWKVYATARDNASLAELRNEGAQPIKLDVAIPESIAGLGWQLDGEKLDLAIYVAGVYGPSDRATSPPARQEFDKVMHTNVLGAMQIIPLVAPMVEAAQGRFVFLSSEMGSIADASSSAAWVYCASKAALNMTVKSASFDYPKAIMVAMSPGWVRTDMGGPNAPLSVEDSVASLLRVAASLTRKESGNYFDYAGGQLAW
jgi:NAD(P)-dependent dehydrogenase (short-subunit alcohol dehydrogenase family)